MDEKRTLGPEENEMVNVMVKLTVLQILNDAGNSLDSIESLGFPPLTNQVAIEAAAQLFTHAYERAVKYKPAHAADIKAIFLEGITARMSEIDKAVAAPLPALGLSDPVETVLCAKPVDTEVNRG